MKRIAKKYGMDYAGTAVEDFCYIRDEYYINHLTLKEIAAKHDIPYEDVVFLFNTYYNTGKNDVSRKIWK